MKKQLMTGLFTVLALTAGAQTFQEWRNPEINAVNRAPMHTNYFAFENADAAKKADKKQSTNYMTLNGTWKFNWVKDADSRPTDFWKTDFNDKGWDDLQVPAVWELNGYGDPIYVNVGYAWRNQFQNNPPEVPTENNHVGSYRREIVVPASWKGKDIIAHFGSVTSNMYLWVNGRYVGYSEDSKLEAEFDLTPYLKPGQKNLIAFQVFRWCDGTYLEDQDFFRYSGVGRDCYLYARNKKRIQDIRVTPDLDAAYQNGSLAVNLDLKGSGKVDLELVDAQGKQVATATANKSGLVTMNVENPKKWSAETPYLYTLRASMQGSNEVIPVKVGFRKIELKGDQILVNGKAVLFKGVDRHEMSPYGGYVMSYDEMLEDIRIMKELNVNAVRTSHYPNDPMWYALCDKYGIYVVDEANIESHGMGYGKESLAHRPDYYQAHLSRNCRMVCRDFNHPSVIVWSMGNEAGNGENFEKVYDWIKAYDTSRPVQYERAELKYNTDVYCPMYTPPVDCEKYLKNNPPKPLILCEYSHAMGNSNGNFKEYWDLVRKYPEFQGGFIWDYVDQAICKKVDARKYGTDHIFIYGGDANDYDASDGSFNCNGILAADRSWHPQTYEIRYQHRSILTTADTKFCTPGKSFLEENKEFVVNVYNENFFIDLSRYRMNWTIEAGGAAVKSGIVENVKAAPGQTVEVGLGISGKDILSAVSKSLRNMPSCTGFGTPDGFIDTDVCVKVSWTLKESDGLLPAGYEVAYDQIVLYEAPASAFNAGSAAVNDIANAEETSSEAVFSGQFIYEKSMEGDRVSDWKAVFDKNTGALSSYVIGGVETLKEPLMPSFGRAVVENDMGANFQNRFKMWRYPEFKVASFNVEKSSDHYVVTTEYAPFGKVCSVTMTYEIHPDGAIVAKEKMNDKGELSKAPCLFRFGMKLAMPGEFSTLDFYGLGPWDNYCDRKSAALLGHYVQRVQDQYWYGYVRTQESGTKSDLRWMKVLSSSGTGIEITSDARFSGSALPFSQKQMDSALSDPRPRKNPTNQQAGEATHSLELLPLAHNDARSLGTTYVNFDLKEMGVGGTDSWGRWPLEPYLVRPAEYEFNFVIRPVK